MTDSYDLFLQELIEWGNNSYKLFIDDERFPITDDWVIVRTSAEAVYYVMTNGFPMEISFDHDLGGDDTSMVFIHSIIGSLIQGDLTIPRGFKYSVHSQNPVGVANIKGLMDNVIRAFGDGE